MKYFFIVMCLFLSGCVSVNPDSESLGGVFEEAKKPLTAIHKVALSMSQEEAASIMGSQIVIGYKLQTKPSQQQDPIVLQQPQRREQLEVQGRVYDVVYYFTEIKKADDLISEDELTPLIFENNHLTGKGWDDLFKLKKAL